MYLDGLNSYNSPRQIDHQKYTILIAPSQNLQFFNDFSHFSAL